MPAMDFGRSYTRRDRGNLPELPVVNMTTEVAPSEGNQVILQSRPGLSDRGANMGSGPVEQLFQRDLVLGSALFGVSNSKLYKDTTLVGAIDGTDPVSMAGYSNILFITAGASLWAYDGTTLAAVEFPDSANVAKVIVGASRAVVIRKDTGKIYWTGVLTDTIDALAFATAEAQPDRALDLLYLNATLLIFGKETVEYWATGTDANLPFFPIRGRVIRKGIKATGCACEIGSTFAWVTNENQVCLGNEDTIISDPGLQERIEASTNVRLFRFVQGGTEFLALRLDTETWVWSMGSKMPSEFKSYGYSNWLPQCYANGVFGSAEDGRTFSWGSGYSDPDGILERRFRAGFPLDGGNVQITNLNLRTNPGQTPYLTGDYANPTVEMRTSRDAGQTWGSWRAASIGAQGQYRDRPTWRALGQASQPGFFAEFRETGPVPFRVSGVFVNESWGGR